MAFKFRREEVTAILKACEGHTFGGAKPTCLFKLTQHLTLSAKEFRELVRYLKSVAMTSIHDGVVGCGLTYRQYLKSIYCAMQALDICNTIKMSAIQAP